ncbi:MAG: hypothetical protein KAT32_04015 [Candidatus Moranbacteria bacterium]|nr:hypothetical protein [Candidatus Moranbacteria bacterium]
MTLFGSLLATFLTIVVEIFIALCLNYRKKEILAGVILVNLITHPAFCFFLYTNSLVGIFSLNNFWIIFLEIIITLVEFGLLFFAFRGDWQKWFILSFLMNLGSFLLGKLIF